MFMFYEDDMCSSRPISKKRAIIEHCFVLTENTCVELIISVCKYYVIT